jgi:outer membrane protein assembly factor BamB
MNRSPQPDADLERRLRRYYERAAGPEPDLDALWARLAAQFEAQEETADGQDRQPWEDHSPRRATLAPLPRRPDRRSRRLVTASLALAAMLLITLLTAALLASRHGNENTSKKLPATAPWSLYFTDAGAVQTDAVDANGHLRWRYQSKVQLTFPPLLFADGVAYSATTDGQIVALNGIDGAVLWSKAISPNTYRTLRVAQVADGVVYASADIGGIANYPAQRNIYALDARTGKLLWTFQQADTIAALADGVLYVYHVPTNDDPSFVQVFALNARDGSTRWHAQIAGNVVGDTRLADGQMYFVVYGGTAADNTMTLYALHTSDGAARWHITRHGLLIADALLAAQGLVYLLEENRDQAPINGLLLALDATTGQQRWQQAGLTGGDQSPLPPIGPYYQNGVIYAAGADQGVYALRASDGAVLWRSQQNSSQRDELLALDNSALYVWQYTYVNGQQQQTNNHLLALNLSDGARRWHYDVPGAIQAVTSHDGVIYGAWAARQAGSLIPHGQTFALNAGDGSLRWTYTDNQIALTWLVAG